MVTPELIELQRQTNESYSLIHEHMIRSATGIVQCPICKEYYYPRISGHECTAQVETHLGQRLGKPGERRK